MPTKKETKVSSNSLTALLKMLDGKSIIAGLSEEVHMTQSDYDAMKKHFETHDEFELSTTQRNTIYLKAEYMHSTFSKIQPFCVRFLSEACGKQLASSDVKVISNQREAGTVKYRATRDAKRTNAEALEEAAADLLK